MYISYTNFWNLAPRINQFSPTWLADVPVDDCFYVGNCPKFSMWPYFNVVNDCNSSRCLKILLLCATDVGGWKLKGVKWMLSCSFGVTKLRFRCDSLVFCCVSLGGCCHNGFVSPSCFVHVLDWRSRVRLQFKCVFSKPNHSQAPSLPIVARNFTWRWCKFWLRQDCFWWNLLS